jgi:hypothetical protein
VSLIDKSAAIHKTSAPMMRRANNPVTAPGTVIPAERLQQARQNRMQTPQMLEGPNMPTGQGLFDALKRQNYDTHAQRFGWNVAKMPNAPAATTPSQPPPTSSTSAPGSGNPPKVANEMMANYSRHSHMPMVPADDLFRLALMDAKDLAAGLGERAGAMGSGAKALVQRILSRR